MTAFIQLDQDKIAELINLFHLARVAGHSKRYDRMQWACDEFCKENPELSKGSVYKNLDRSIS